MGYKLLGTASRSFITVYFKIQEDTKPREGPEPSYEEGEKKFRKNSCLEASRTQRPAERLGTAKKNQSVHEGTCAKNPDQLLSISNEGTRGGNRLKLSFQLNSKNRVINIIVCPWKSFFGDGSRYSFAQGRPAFLCLACPLW